MSPLYLYHSENMLLLERILSMRYSFAEILRNAGQQSMNLKKKVHYHSQGFSLSGQEQLLSSTIHLVTKCSRHVHLLHLYLEM